ncbi:trypsin-like serine peptidase [Staphylococcus cornubiensis]|uniref:trypsin-like serine peptidase n=1 Tax=Staphylococcus cornubiensis TaxID=1986155 RepID=UPI000A3C5066|nr:trypsin-like peptidase domain-containing protein [Staphylococcus cornubiensis]
MKKLRLIILFSLACLLLMPFDSVYAKGKLTPIPDTVADTHSKLTAFYKTASGRYCTAILISSTAALTAKHCIKSPSRGLWGTIFPGASRNKTPFGYMNIRTYKLHPNSKYDLAIIKGTDRDQDEFYKYYIGKFTTTVKGYTNAEFKSFIGQDVYAYGYPHGSQLINNMQYRSDGKITNYKTKPYINTDMPAYPGQSGSGVFKKDSKFIGLMVKRTSGNTGVVLPFTKDIADWINQNMN